MPHWIKKSSALLPPPGGKRFPTANQTMRDAPAMEQAASDVAFDSNAGRWVLAVAVLGSGMAFLDSTVVNVALPDIGRDLGAPPAPCNGSSTAIC